MSRFVHGFTDELMKTADDSYPDRFSKGKSYNPDTSKSRPTNLTDLLQSTNRGAHNAAGAVARTAKTIRPRRKIPSSTTYNPTPAKRHAAPVRHDPSKYPASARRDGSGAVHVPTGKGWKKHDPSMAVKPRSAFARTLARSGLSPTGGKLSRGETQRAVRDTPRMLTSSGKGSTSYSKDLGAGKFRHTLTSPRGDSKPAVVDSSSAKRPRSFSSRDQAPKRRRIRRPKPKTFGGRWEGEISKMDRAGAFKEPKPAKKAPTLTDKSKDFFKEQGRGKPGQMAGVPSGQQLPTGPTRALNNPPPRPSAGSQRWGAGNPLATNARLIQQAQMERRQRQPRMPMKGQAATPQVQKKPVTPIQKPSMGFASSQRMPSVPQTGAQRFAKTVSSFKPPVSSATVSPTMKTRFSRRKLPAPAPNQIVPAR